jgi:hypothetical protein
MGAAGAESCVPQQSQLAPEAGQAFFAPGSPTQPLLRLSPQPTDLAGCLAACPANSCCWAQYNATNGSCAAAVLEPADAHTSVSGLLLLHRLPAAAMAAASSAAARPRASAQTLASGAYAACAIPAAAAGAWQAGAGTSLGADARTFATASVWDAATTRARCQAKCDESNVCFGVIWDATNQACLYRGGVGECAACLKACVLLDCRRHGDAHTVTACSAVSARCGERACLRLQLATNTLRPLLLCSASAPCCLRFDPPHPPHKQTRWPRARFLCCRLLWTWGHCTGQAAPPKRQRAAAAARPAAAPQATAPWLPATARPPPATARPPRATPRPQVRAASVPSTAPALQFAKPNGSALSSLLTV